MKKCIFFSILLYLSVNVNAQNTISPGLKIQPLKVGDTLPQNVALHMVNFPSASATFSDFKGEPLILDFWSTGCSSCILSWPHLKELQKQVGNRLQILLVNPWQDKVQVKEIFEKRKRVAGVNMDMPSTCGDSALLNYFNVSSVPAEYWVNSQGVIKYITYLSSLKTSNLEGFINGVSLNMPQLINDDDYISRDVTRPLFLEGNGGIPQKILWQSIFGKADPKLSPGLGIGANQKSNCYAFATGSIRDIYALAYGNRQNEMGISELLPNQVFLEVRDSSKYLNFIDGDYYYNHNYVYQLISPLVPLSEVQHKMQGDLNTYIGLNVHWEKRKKKCLVLMAKDSLRLQYKEGSYLSNVDYAKIVVNKIPMSLLMDMLEQRVYYLSPYPLINETGFKGLLGNISIETDLTSPQLLNKGLAKYGLEFKLQDRVVNVLVLSEPEDFHELGIKE